MGLNLKTIPPYNSHMGVENLEFELEIRVGLFLEMLTK